jgi:hypothetical protein
VASTSKPQDLGVPSQKGEFPVCLQTQNHFCAVSAARYLSGVKPTCL